MVICTLSAKVEDEYRVNGDVIRDGLRRYAQAPPRPGALQRGADLHRSPAWADPGTGNSVERLERDDPGLHRGVAPASYRGLQPS